MEIICQSLKFVNKILSLFVWHTRLILDIRIYGNVECSIKKVVYIKVSILKVLCDVGFQNNNKDYKQRTGLSQAVQTYHSKMFLNPFPPTLKFTYIAMFPLRKTRKRISKFGQLC